MSFLLYYLGICVINAVFNEFKSRPSTNSSHFRKPPHSIRLKMICQNANHMVAVTAHPTLRWFQCSLQPKTIWCTIWTWTAYGRRAESISASITVTAYRMLGEFINAILVQNAFDEYKLVEI